MALRGKGYEEFLPLYSPATNGPDARQRPLFPGYVFCRFDSRNPLSILTTPGVRYVVSAGKRPMAVLDREIASLQVLIASGLPVRPSESFEVGDPLVVVEGPLKGVQGTLVDFRGKARLAVSVSLLRRSVTVEIDIQWARRATWSMAG